MANIIRSAKSGSDWTRNELRAFNIQTVTDDVATFFGNPELLPPSVRQAILVNEHYPIGGLPDKDDRFFFDLMKYAMQIVPGQESAVDEFMGHLLNLLGYDEPDHIVRQWVERPLFMCGRRVLTKADVCVINGGGDIILLVQEDKTPGAAGTTAAAYCGGSFRLSEQQYAVVKYGSTHVQSDVHSWNHNIRYRARILQDQHYGCSC